MKEKIKIIYLILGIPLLILMITVLTIWVSRQINLEFFTFDQEKCIYDYLIEKDESKFRNIRDAFNNEVVDEKLKGVAQFWNLDPETIKEIAREKQKEYQEWIKRKQKHPGGRTTFEELLKKEEGDFIALTLKELLNEQIKHNKLSNLTDSLIKELTSEEICLRPSLLK